MRTLSLPRLTAAVLATVLLTACNPKYNWRDYRGQDAGFAVQFPDKPDAYTRSINLNGLVTNMTMTAARVDGVLFAVGNAQAPDAAQAQLALRAMRTALLKNIGATITKEGTSAANGTAGATSGPSIDIEASGSQNGVPTTLIGHFEARGNRFYQVIVMGKQKAIVRDQVETFMSSFKAN